MRVWGQLGAKIGGTDYTSFLKSNATKLQELAEECLSGVMRGAATPSKLRGANPITLKLACFPILVYTLTSPERSELGYGNSVGI